jgi:DNA-binding protein HU-beta
MYNAPIHAALRKIPLSGRYSSGFIGHGGGAFKYFLKEEDSMTKADLVAQMASSAGITKAAAEKALNGFLKGVSGALKKGDKVTLVGFGTFSVAKRAAREGRNPQTGKKIKIKATKVVKFKAGSKLKAMVK